MRFFIIYIFFAFFCLDFHLISSAQFEQQNVAMKRLKSASFMLPNAHMNKIVLGEMMIVNDEIGFLIKVIKLNESSVMLVIKKTSSKLEQQISVFNEIVERVKETFRNLVNAFERNDELIDFETEVKNLKNMIETEVEDENQLKEVVKVVETETRRMSVMEAARYEIDEPPTDSLPTLNTLIVGNTVQSQLLEAENKATFSLPQREVKDHIRNARNERSGSVLLWFLFRFIVTSVRVLNYFAENEGETFSMNFPLRPEVVCLLANGACSSGQTNATSVYRSYLFVTPSGFSAKAGIVVSGGSDGSKWFDVKLNILPPKHNWLFRNLKVKATFTLVNRRDGNGSLSQTKESYGPRMEFAFKAPSNVKDFVVDDELTFERDIVVTY